MPKSVKISDPDILKLVEMVSERTGDSIDEVAKTLIVMGLNWMTEKIEQDLKKMKKNQRDVTRRSI